MLVVDDTKSNRLLLQKQLTSLNLCVHCASNGREAVDWVKDGNHCRLVLMDRSMPVMDGVEATRQILAFDPTLPVIGATADPLSEARSAFEDVGASAVLTKPVHVGALRSVIDSYVKEDDGVS